MPHLFRRSSAKKPLAARFAFLLFALLLATNGYGQHLFPEKFKGCITDHFTLEKDTVTAKTDTQALLALVTSALSEAEVKSIRGALLLQILVDTGGNSCLLSVENKTNVKTKKLRLKESIDSQLRWDKPAKKVAAVVLLQFTNGSVTMKRLGMDGNMGVQELRP
ncbi:hypothetical protein [Hymenobacter cellulosilyticus]|uniref:Uncharacterized protein n=1 Tax=Hymenobacter cellulosilyticus TaxID=2932248 RepID=A0A8T9QC21_9BACT|nr:hypothetical protein [Hymenobacter cellulosilyticus]UOQ74502.1 hypothetical protein MUN79_11835 [Hymenobacter cellulosilyticus]